MIEKPAKGQKGYLLYNPITERYWFRIYDPVDRSKHKDYQLCAEEVEVEITSGSLSFYDKEGKEERNLLDWSSKVLGRPK